MRLTLAIPSKGRLKADAEALLARAGLPVVPPADERSYRTQRFRYPPDRSFGAATGGAKNRYQQKRYDHRNYLCR